MIRLTFGALMLLASPALAEQAIVCPPHLDYCYKKPVLQEKKFDDMVDELRAQIYRDRLAIQQEDRELRSRGW
jgi:hypothetical protein